MAVESRCPAPEDWQQFLLGLMAAPEIEQFAAHLDTCPQCAAVADNLRTTDTLVDSLRGQTDIGLPEDTSLGRPVEEVSEIFSPSWAVDDAGDVVTERYREVLSPPEGPDEIGRLGPYRVLGFLGAGGMGVVFDAEEIALGRRVALKIINPRLAADPDIRQRFLREARAAAAIDDARIVTIHRVDQEHGVLYIAMQRLRGQSLEQYLQQVEELTGHRLLTITEALHIARETARGLASAHAHGLIHRDIKPGNIFLRPETDSRLTHEPVVDKQGSSHVLENDQPLAFSIKLLDFGLARLINDDTGLTNPGAPTGTPAYAAPEQHGGETVDPRADLFSLGCVLYRMVTGRMPFLAGRYGSLSVVSEEGPVPPRKLNQEVPAELSALIVDLLHRDPQRRPASADLVVERLTEIIRLHNSLPATVRKQPQTKRRLRRSMILAVALIAALFIGFSALGGRPGEVSVAPESRDVAMLLQRSGGVTIRHTHRQQRLILFPGRQGVPPGEYEIEPDQGRDFVFSSRRFFVRPGRSTTLSVTHRSKSTVPEPVVDPLATWINEVAGLSAEKQVEAVGKKLQELNPGFDGKIGPRYEGRHVIEAHFVTDSITDINPIRALPHLQYLVCRGSAASHGKLADLLPVKALPDLIYLDCSANPIRDLYVLRGTKVRELVCWATPITDLEPLRNLPLTMLNIDSTFVSSLEPLRNLPLTRLFLKAPYITSLDVVKRFALTEISCQFRPERHSEILRGITSLRSINDQSAREFWGAQDRRRESLAVWIPHTAALPAEEQLKAVSSKLSELNPGFKGRLFPQVQNGEVVKLILFGDRVTDIAPLSALTKLKHLTIRIRSQGKRGPLFDLDPLRQLPLRNLEFRQTEVADLSPLAGSHLKSLSCSGTWVRDLSPLKDMPIHFLDCRTTPVEDLSPLVTCKITELLLNGCPIKDFSPLAQLPLRKLSIDLGTPHAAEVVRGFPDLIEINGKPKGEFWTVSAAKSQK